MRNEIFNKVAMHLMTQMKRATTHEQCVYRTNDGLKCAIGCLIPDEKYTRHMEGHPFYDLISIWPELVFPFGIDSDPLIRNMLWDLQKVHDNFQPVHWERELNKVGLKWGVTSECLRAN